VTEAKLAAQRSARPGESGPFVGARGERWRPEVSPCEVAPAPSLDGIPLVAFRGPGADIRGATGLRHTNDVSALHLCHIVVVDDIAARWGSPAALGARLLGLSLVCNGWLATRAGARPAEGIGTRVAFAQACRRQARVTLLVEASFERENPEHMRPLELWPVWRPEVQVLRGPLAQEAVHTPTWTLVSRAQQKERQQVGVIDLAGLLYHCTEVL
jgi:hypothetical protein